MTRHISYWCGPYVLHVDGPLRAPLGVDLHERVRALLHGGSRSIVLDLARVPAIDAVGVGELVRVYNMTLAAGGVLRVVHASRLVREILQRVGLFDVLSANASNGASMSPPLSMSAWRSSERSLVE